MGKSKKIIFNLTIDDLRELGIIKKKRKKGRKGRNKKRVLLIDPQTGAIIGEPKSDSSHMIGSTQSIQPSNTNNVSTAIQQANLEAIENANKRAKDQRQWLIDNGIDPKDPTIGLQSQDRFPDRNTTKLLETFGDNVSDQFGQLKDTSEWHPDWTAERALIIAIPLNMNKRLIKTGVSKLLDSHIQSRRGRKALRDADSSALYPLARNYTAKNLKTALAVYDLWHNGKVNPEEKLFQWKIGVKVGLNRLSVKEANSSDKQESYIGRNKLNATVNRYIKDAQKIIKGIEKGEFPAV
jgi:hypothetical protein